jgi:hypothetical protein
MLNWLQSNCTVQLCSSPRNMTIKLRAMETGTSLLTELISAFILQIVNDGNYDDGGFNNGKGERRGPFR